jgi:hypothetical protein
MAVKRAMKILCRIWFQWKSNGLIDTVFPGSQSLEHLIFGGALVLKLLDFGMKRWNRMLHLLQIFLHMLISLLLPK